MALRLLLLGGARLELDGGPVTGRAAQRRRIAVLALLVRAPRRTLARERILAYLWPEHSPEAARRLLSEAVYVIRRDLGESLITAVGDEITLADVVECDVDDFLDAVRREDHARVVALYTGPLLDGWYVRDAPELERWVEAERVELAALHLKSLRARTLQREAAGDWSGAAAGWQAIVRLDPYGSTAVLYAARALVAAGEPAAALHQIGAHEALLREDLGVGLDAELSALASDIRAGRVQPKRPVAEAASSPAPREAPNTAAHTPKARVEPSTDTRATSPSDPTVVSPPAARRTSRARIVVAATVALVSAAVLVYALAPGRSRATTPPPSAEGALDLRRIAVLYFEDQSPDGSLRHVADGLAEALIGELAEVRTLRVLSKDATRRFRGSGAPADSIGRALRAGTVIGATVREAGGRVRVVARLVDAATGEQVAQVQAEQPRGDLFALEDSLAGNTAAALRARLGVVIRLRRERRAALVGGRSSRALELVLRAERIRKDAELARVSLRADTGVLTGVRRQLRAADSMLALAETIDPTWPRPSLERGWVAATEARLEHGATRAVALAPAVAHAERALATLRERAPSDTVARAEALYLRGLLRLRLAMAVQTFRAERGLSDAEADLDAAVTGDSTLAGAWAALSMARWIRGDFSGAQGAAQRALAMDAFLENADEVIGWAWRSAYYLGEREQAMRWCSRGRGLLPDDWHFIECELTILRLDAAGLTGRRPDAARAWAIVRDLERADPEPRARGMGRPYSPIYRRLAAAAVSAAAGQRDSARRVLAVEQARVRGDQELSTDILYDAAFLHLTVGDTARAQAAIEAYLRARPDLDALVGRDPTLRGVKRALERVPNNSPTAAQ